MGICGTSPEAELNKKISKKLYQLDEEDKKESKLLLLGTGASGKSTVFKQMKLIHTSGWKDKEKLEFKAPLFNNILDIFNSIIEACETFGYKIDSKHKEIIDYIIFCSNKTDAFQYSPEVANNLLSLWEDDEVKKCVAEGSKFDLLDSTP
jgi:hypothetical protein